MKNKIPISLTLLSFLYLNFMFQNAHAQSYTLYGITQFGGTYNEGVLYRYEYPSGNDTILVNFNDTIGFYPRADIMEASDGNLYSTTSEGGIYNEGVLYCFNPQTYKDTVLVNFGGANGANPHNALFEANNGLLYGLTFTGGMYGLGVCYSYSITSHTQTVLFNFNDTNGANPTGYVIQAPNGWLIGHAQNGGLYGDGTIFYYNIITGRDSVLINLDGTDGKEGLGGLLLASNGLFYGTTLKGGTDNYGVLYSYDLTANTLTDLFSFTGTNGIYPSYNRKGLIQASSGLLYGLTEMGGTYNNGVIYSYDINTNRDSVMLNFYAFDTIGNNPYSEGLTQISTGGQIITPMDSGGMYGFGTLISFNPSTGKFTKLIDFNDTNGSYPIGDVVVFENDQSSIAPLGNIATASLFPNPNNGIFTIKQTAVKGQLVVDIYNMLGKNIYSEALAYNKGGNIFNLSSQPKGIYLYRLTSIDGSVVSSGKFIIE